RRGAATRSRLRLSRPPGVDARSIEGYRGCETRAITRGLTEFRPTGSEHQGGHILMRGRRSLFGFRSALVAAPAAAVVLGSVQGQASNASAATRAWATRDLTGNVRLA